MFEKEFVAALQDLYSRGNTYERIAALTGLSRTSVASAISGSRPPKNLTVDSLLKAFPDAKISLNGDSNININADRNSGNVVGINNGSVATGVMEQAIDRILAADELSAEEKIKVLKVLRK